jgi:hypothetical protein
MTIQASQARSAFRVAFKAFIGKYFDGKAHTFGAETLTFPKVDVVFDRPQLGGALPYPLLYAQDASMERNQRKANKTGMHLTVEEPYRLIVYTADVERNWRVNDKIQDYLAVMLNGAGYELGQAGWRIVRVNGAMPLTFDADQALQVSERIIVFRSELEFAIVTE